MVIAVTGTRLTARQVTLRNEADDIVVVVIEERKMESADDIVVVVVEERKMESARQDSRKAECRVRGKFGHKTSSPCAKICHV